MILRQLFSKKPDQTQALYGAIVAAARQPKFYQAMAVPDTVDGRFDMVVLVLFLVLERLQGEASETRQNLTDYFFMDMDRSLREMGVGDLSVGKKVRRMAEAFHGRIQAYVVATQQGGAALNSALQRNVYGGEASPESVLLLRWMKDARAILANISTDNLLAAKLDLAA